jgi:tRNA (mo5U34)-methyltransferase
VTTWTPDALRAEVATRTWFHSIDLGNGVITPGQKNTIEEVAVMQIPADLTGKSVLDIGAYDGFYSFACEARGAARVLASDHWTWTWPGTDARRNFELAREALGSKVEDQVIKVEDLSPEAVGGQFDVVLFLGVLYHAPDPLGYLERVRSVTAPGGFAIIETAVDLLDIPVPALGYYPGASLNGDGSNHYGPNPAAVEGLCLDAGFSRVQTFEPWSTNTWWSVEHLATRNVNQGPDPKPRSGRQTFHAYP